MRSQPKPLYGQTASEIRRRRRRFWLPLAVHSFHLHTDQRQMIEQVFKAYGVKAMLDDSVRADSDPAGPG